MLQVQLFAAIRSLVVVFVLQQGIVVPALAGDTGAGSVPDGAEGSSTPGNNNGNGYPDERRVVEAVWLFYATLISLEQESPAQSWRWLRDEAGMGPEMAGTLLAFAIEATMNLSELAEDMHKENCERLAVGDPTIADVARAIDETNAALVAFRRDTVDGMSEILPAEYESAIMALVRDEFVTAVRLPELDVQMYLEATGEDADTLVSEMCQ